MSINIEVQNSRSATEISNAKNKNSSLNLNTYADLVKLSLKCLGEDENRQGLLDTPLRVAKSMEFLTSGYKTNPQEVINDALFDAEGSAIVVQKKIEFYSLCEHHLLPFHGHVDIAYQPNKKIIGLSKLPRIVEIFARRLQVQERMTEQIIETIEEFIQPLGVMVRVKAHHFCMMMRGIQKQNSFTITQNSSGVFKDNLSMRQEARELLLDR